MIVLLLIRNLKPTKSQSLLGDEVRSCKKQYISNERDKIIFYFLEFGIAP